jgi:transglutaminase-like putative cysteine protease
VHLTIRHRTSYSYDSAIERGVQLVRLWPAPHAGMTVGRWSVSARGGRVGSTFLDGLGNRCGLVDLEAGPAHDILVEGEVQTRATDAVVTGASEPLAPAYFLRVTQRTAADEAISALAAKMEGEGAERLVSLMHAVRDRVAYGAGATDVGATAASALRTGEGVCQDHAHVYCAAARAAGVPARYVSGYLFAGDMGAAASHAWVEAFDGARWIGLDPANRALAEETHVRLAVGLDYREAAPIVGARSGGGTERMNVEVAVAAQ